VPPQSGPGLQTAPGSSPPTAAPSYPPQPQSDPGQSNPYGSPPSAYLGQPPGTAGAPYGSPYPSQPYGQYAPYGGAPGVRSNNGLAIASLVCACLGWLFFLPAVLAVVFGFVARSQIRQAGGSQGGDGLAIAGIIVGFAWIALLIILIAVGVANNNNTSGVVSLTTSLTLLGR
jgi:hypothetical protein